MASSMLTLTNEEKNFIRFSILNFKVCPPVVRTFFDSLFPPATLAQAVNQNIKIIEGLIAKKRINAVQEAILRNIQGTVWKHRNPTITFGTGAPTSSSDFDLTLMICLIRNIGTVNPPFTGWDKLPSMNDKSDGAFIARLKYYRNELAHSTVSTMSDSEFKDKWSSIEEALTYFNGGRTLQEITNILNFDLDGQNEKLFAELDNLKQECKDCEEKLSIAIASEEQVRIEFDHYKTGNLPHNIAENIKSLLNTWENDNKTYFETSRCKQFMTDLTTKDYVTVIGSSGSGKSALVRHAALYLKNNEEFSIIPVEDPEKVLEYKTDEKQIFIVDDVLGKYSIFLYTLNKWERREEKLKQCFKSEGKTKIVCILRSQVAKTHNFKCAKSFLTENVFDIEDESLSINEKRAIFMKHLDNSDISCIVSEDEITEICKTNFAFPLLCKLVTCDLDRFNAKLHFFKHPFQVFKSELDKLSSDNLTVYCTLVLCMILNGRIRRSDILSEKYKELIHTLVAGCGLTEENISPKYLLDKLEHIVGTYIVQNGNEFNFIHDKLFESVSSHFAHYNTRVMLELCDFEFIRDRVRIGLKLPSDDETIVLLDSLSADIISRRMFCELRNGNFANVVQTLVIKDSDVIKELCYVIATYSTYYDVLQSRDNSVKSFFEKLLDDQQNQNDLKTLLMESQYQFIYWIVAYSCYDLLKQMWNGLTKRQKRTLLDRDSFFLFSKSLFPFSILVGNIDIVELFLPYSDINCFSITGATPLTIAVQTERPDIVKLLLDNGASVNKPEMFNQSLPLLRCIEVSDIQDYSERYCNENILELLLNHKANITSRDIYGNSFLSKILFEPSILKSFLEICDNGQSENLRHIFKNGKDDVNISMESTNEDCVIVLTPIQTAVAFGLTHIAEKLFSLKKSSYLNSVKKRKECHKKKKAIDLSPLHIAVINDNIELALICLKYGACVNKVDLFGRSPFHYVKSVQMATTLIEFTKKNDEKNIKFESNTPLLDNNLSDNIIREMNAVSEDTINLEFQESPRQIEPSLCFIVKSVLLNSFLNFGFNTCMQMNAPLNIRDQNGNTALHCIAQNPDSPFKTRIIKLFLENGGTKYIRNDQDKFPCELLNSKEGWDELKLSDNFTSKERLVKIVDSILMMVITILFLYFSFWLNAKIVNELPNDHQECLIEPSKSCYTNKCNETITDLNISQNNPSTIMYILIFVVLFLILNLLQLRSVSLFKHLDIKMLIYFIVLQILKSVCYVLYISVGYTKNPNDFARITPFSHFRTTIIFVFFDLKVVSYIGLYKINNFRFLLKYYVLLFVIFLFVVFYTFISFSLLSQHQFDIYNHWELTLSCRHLSLNGNVSTSMCLSEDNNTNITIMTSIGISNLQYVIEKNSSTLCTGILSEQAVLKHNFVYFICSSLCAIISILLCFYFIPVHVCPCQKTKMSVEKFEKRLIPYMVTNCQPYMRFVCLILIGAFIFEVGFQ